MFLRRVKVLCNSCTDLCRTLSTKSPRTGPRGHPGRHPMVSPLTLPGPLFEEFSLCVRRILFWRAVTHGLPTRHGQRPSSSSSSSAGGVAIDICGGGCTEPELRTIVRNAAAYLPTCLPACCVPAALPRASSRMICLPHYPQCTHAFWDHRRLGDGENKGGKVRTNSVGQKPGEGHVGWLPGQSGQKA